MTDINLAANQRIRGNWIIEERIEFGMAARKNRGSYMGRKIHRLYSEYVVGLVDPNMPEPVGTYGYRFLRSGAPCLFSCSPICGCTQGQHAASPNSRFTMKNVTCSKCGITQGDSK